MKNIKNLLVVESSIALVLLGAIIYLFVAGGLPLTGNIISGPGTSTIALMDRATLNGRALSGTDVTLIGNPVTKPTG